METSDNQRVRKVVLLLLAILILGFVGIFGWLLLNQSGNSDSGLGGDQASSTTSTSIVGEKYTNISFGYEITVPSGWVANCGVPDCGSKPASNTEEMPSFRKTDTSTGMPYFYISTNNPYRGGWQDEKNKLKGQMMANITVSDVQLNGTDALAFESMQTPNPNITYFTKSYLFPTPGKSGMYTAITTYDNADKSAQGLILSMIKSLKFQ